jgi:methylmalonyl-CoA mutase N-terminal domain/subunit
VGVTKYQNRSEKFQPSEIEKTKSYSVSNPEIEVLKPYRATEEIELTILK